MIHSDTECQHPRNLLGIHFAGLKSSITSPASKTSRPTTQQTARARTLSHISTQEWNVYGEQHFSSIEPDFPPSENRKFKSF